MSVGRARRHHYQSIRQQQQFAAYTARIDKLLFFGDKILDLASDFRKLGSVAMLWSLIRICLQVQIDTEMAKKYAKQRYAVSSNWKICHRMCVSINVPGDLDLWPFDLETGMRVTSKVGNLHSEFQHTRPSGPGVICYVCNRRTCRFACLVDL